MKYEPLKGTNGSTSTKQSLQYFHRILKPSVILAIQLMLRTVREHQEPINGPFGQHKNAKHVIQLLPGPPNSDSFVNQPKDPHFCSTEKKKSGTWHPCTHRQKISVSFV